MEMEGLTIHFLDMSLGSLPRQIIFKVDCDLGPLSTSRSKQSRIFKWLPWSGVRHIQSLYIVKLQYTIKFISHSRDNTVVICYIIVLVYIFFRKSKQWSMAYDADTQYVIKCCTVGNSFIKCKPNPTTHSHIWHISVKKISYEQQHRKDYFLCNTVQTHSSWLEFCF